MNHPQIGRDAYALIEELYPICRSITGNGFRRSMEILQKHIPLCMNEVPSGTKVFDWTVPKEWNIRDAYVKNENGDKVIDFNRSNLHIVGYSVPFKGVMSLDELRPHLFTDPALPGHIPYRTSYYVENWGFCLSYQDYLRLQDGLYEVFIGSDLEAGSLTYGELYLAGEEPEEVLISCHACHPSLCNDNLSGVSIATLLAEHMGGSEHRYSYRFLFVPGTIGAITWLALNEDRLPNIRHGLVLSGLGDVGNITYKRSRRGDAEVDRAVSQVLRDSELAFQILDFAPFGSDERQYCSPGFNLPVGCLSRSPYGAYPEYHTSGDNLDFVDPERLGESYRVLSEALQLLESNRRYINTNPKCEPHLGRRGLYPSGEEARSALLWVLNLSDGSRDLLGIAEKSGATFNCIREAATQLLNGQLLTPLETSGTTSRRAAVESATKAI
jgi:aminopeptidase-like protein